MAWFGPLLAGSAQQLAVVVVEPLPDSPAYFGLAVPPATPTAPDFAAPRDPQVDKDFFALARMASAQSYLEDVEQWLRDEIGESEEWDDVFGDGGLGLDAGLSGRGRRRR